MPVDKKCWIQCPQMTRKIANAFRMSYTGLRKGWTCLSMIMYVFSLFC